MGRRRKSRRRIRRVVRRLPTIFQCPRCGQMNVTIEINKGDAESIAIIRCGSCKLRTEMHVPPIFQAVDVYAKFLDMYESGTLTITPYEEGE